MYDSAVLRKSCVERDLTVGRKKSLYAQTRRNVKSRVNICRIRGTTKVKTLVVSAVLRADDKTDERRSRVYQNGPTGAWVIRP